jgi:hypothetical protein
MFALVWLIDVFDRILCEFSGEKDGCEEEMKNCAYSDAISLVGSMVAHCFHAGF